MSSLLLEVFKWKLDNIVSVLVILKKQTIKEVHLMLVWLHISSCKPTYTEFITKPIPHTQCYSLKLRQLKIFDVNSFIVHGENEHPIWTRGLLMSQDCSSTEEV